MKASRGRLHIRSRPINGVNSRTAAAHAVASLKRGTAEVHVVVETTPGCTARAAHTLVCRRTTNWLLRPFCVRGPVAGHLPRHLRRQRYRSVGGPRIRADNVEQIYLADPDGHIIELLCSLDQPVANQRRAELAASGEGVPVAPDARCCNHLGLLGKPLLISRNSQDPWIGVSRAACTSRPC
jgi:hypothetical protein